MPGKPRRETKSERQARVARDALGDAFQNASTQGRTPNLRLPTKPTVPKEAAAPDAEIPISSEPAGLPGFEPRKKRIKGSRDAKVTGLHLVLQDVRENGFPHPLEHGSFLMVPRVFKALLALEPLAVIQIVFEIFDQTIGWEDPQGAHRRREWCQLSFSDFEMSCGMTRSQVQRGIRRGLDHRYIERREHAGSFEYAIHWKHSDYHE